MAKITKARADFELRKAQLVIRFWENSEKIEMSFSAFIFGVIVIPVLLKTDFSLSRGLNGFLLVSGILVLFIIGFFIIRSRMNHYCKKQIEVLENLKGFQVT